VDSRFTKLNLADSELRASTVGVVARAAEQRKRDSTGGVEEQRTRGNAATMQERCRREGINFWPIAVEGDGFASTQFTDFFNNVCNAACELTDKDPGSFKSYWKTRFGCLLTKNSARLTLRRAANVRQFYANRGRGFSDVDEDFTGESQMRLPIYVSDRSSFRARNASKRYIAQRRWRPSRR
jgi:hypothetical protein